jgi:nucleotide-binding universal stress UspA family protein
MPAGLSAHMGAIMVMKTILVPIEKHDGMQSVLRTALVLARQYKSYIEGVPLRWVSEDFVVGGDVTVAFPVEQYRQEVAAEEKRIHQAFDSFMRENKVPRSGEGEKYPSYGWLNEPPEGESFVGSYGRAFDIILMNRIDSGSPVRYRKALESALFDSGRPVLLSPPSPPERMGVNILIAWNGSTEQTRAIAFSMPLLGKAKRVTVLTVKGGTGVPGPSAEQMIRYLRYNDIAAEPLTVELGGKSTGEAILNAAKQLDCDLLIKGAFTQSRLRQMIFGGATQHVMANAELPVLLAH